MQQTKYIVVTGGVISGLGKGIAAASIGHLLSGKFKVIPIKCDGYLNVDPGTMNPFEHGEVFVLDDGGEVDMDFGHYERFLGIHGKIDWNLTMGKVFQNIREKERRGDYLGKTVQYIPHVVDYIKNHFYETAKKEKADIMLIEVGGTVGDIENELYVEAVSELKREVGADNVMYVHLTYVPIPDNVHEQKSKPTQQSVNLLRQRGIQPDIIIARCHESLTGKIKEKIALFSGISKEAVISGVDMDNVYEIPIDFYKQGIVKLIEDKFKIKVGESASRWEKLLNNMKNPEKEVTIAICGKYTDLQDSYASVIEALHHSAANLKCKVNMKWIETTDIENGKIKIEEALKNVSGVVVPGGFGSRGVEGKIGVIKYCREKNLPFLGLCYGLQLAVIEFARHVCGLKDANSTEINPKTENPVIDMLPDQLKVHWKGGTMRLGGHDIKVKDGTKAYELFGDVARKRFRHRYEVNPEFASKIEEKGMIFSGKTQDEKIVQIIELPKHKYFMATQAHPELTSTLDNPSKLFYSFVKACM